MGGVTAAAGSVKRDFSFSYVLPRIFCQQQQATSSYHELYLGPLYDSRGTLAYLMPKSQCRRRIVLVVIRNELFAVLIWNLNEYNMKIVFANRF